MAFQNQNRWQTEKSGTLTMTNGMSYNRINFLKALF